MLCKKIAFSNYEKIWMSIFVLGLWRECWQHAIPLISCNVITNMQWIFIVVLIFSQSHWSIYTCHSRASYSQTQDSFVTWHLMLYIHKRIGSAVIGYSWKSSHDLTSIWPQWRLKRTFFHTKRHQNQWITKNTHPSSSFKCKSKISKSMNARHFFFLVDRLWNTHPMQMPFWTHDAQNVEMVKEDSIFAMRSYERHY